MSPDPISIPERILSQARHFLSGCTFGRFEQMFTGAGIFSHHDASADA
jgi:hypothetical protein